MYSCAELYGLSNRNYTDMPLKSFALQLPTRATVQPVQARPRTRSMRTSSFGTWERARPRYLPANSPPTPWPWCNLSSQSATSTWFLARGTDPGPSSKEPTSSNSPSSKSWRTLTQESFGALTGPTTMPFLPLHPVRSKSLSRCGKESGHSIRILASCTLSYLKRTPVLRLSDSSLTSYSTRKHMGSLSDWSLAISMYGHIIYKIKHG